MKIVVTPGISEDIKDVIYTCQKMADAAREPVKLDASLFAQNVSMIIYPNGNPLLAYSHYLQQLRSNVNTKKEGH